MISKILISNLSKSFFYQVVLANQVFRVPYTDFNMYSLNQSVSWSKLVKNEFLVKMVESWIKWCYFGQMMLWVCLNMFVHASFWVKHGFKVENGDLVGFGSTLKMNLSDKSLRSWSFLYDRMCVFTIVKIALTIVKFYCCIIISVSVYDREESVYSRE